MSKISNDKELQICLDDLGIPKECIINENFNDVNVLNLLIVNGVSKEALGNKILISKYFKNINDYKKYYHYLSDKLNINYYEKDNLDEIKTLLNDNCFIIPKGMTVLEFYESIRNQ